MAAGGSDDEEEELVSVGTPLEPLEEGERIKKPIPLQEQTVKDEKGRYKRFHGAFSGGFSAGYFNTVGSKEGWAPSAFISSRQKRAERTVHGPEDFMDEEDLSEHGIAPNKITITDAFASKSKDAIQEKARQIARIIAPIPGASVLDEFITPAKITIGVDLLRKMGWKEGQGIGPRLKRKPRKQKPEPGVKIYGCALPPGSEDSEEEDEYQPENVTFAPKDVIPVDLTPKENVHGLGYKGLDPTKALFGASEEHLNLFSVDSEHSSHLGDLQHSKGRKLGISGQAFGVGALEEEDADIYATESLSKYDSVLKDEEPGDGLYGWTAPQQYKSKPAREREVNYIGKILDGFSLASKPSTLLKIYPPPDLPKDYRPFHYFQPVVKASGENFHLVKALAESTGKLQSDAMDQSRHTKTASERREILGEVALRGPPTSVLEYLSEKDKERIQAVKKVVVQQEPKTQMQPQQPGYNKTQAPPLSDTLQKRQLNLGCQLATTGFGDFKPFAKDPEKQKRYERYLENLAHGRKAMPENCFDLSMTEWERGREQEEFSRSAILYRPSSSALSSRFTPAKLEDDTDKVEVPRDQETDVDDKAAAAKMKMFGKLTRERFEWHPDKTLCKRFNIPDPYSESCVVGLPKVKRDKYSVFNFLTIPSESMVEVRNQTMKEGAQQNNILNKPKKSSRWDVSDKEKKKKDAIGEFISLARSKVDSQEQLPLTVETKAKPGADDPVPKQEGGQSPVPSEAAAAVVEEESRPSMDLFKAIFASSSDEKSSSEEESDGEEPSAATLAGNLEIHEPPAATLSTQETEVIPEVSNTVTPTPKEVVGQGEEFGPRLPPGASSGTPEVVTKRKPKKSKEKHKAKKEHKHKKEKKKKHKKGKHKSKHKNTKSEKTSSSSSAEDSESSNEGETTYLSPEGLLRRLKHLPLIKQ